MVNYCTPAMLVADIRFQVAEDGIPQPTEAHYTTTTNPPTPTTTPTTTLTPPPAFALLHSLHAATLQRSDDLGAGLPICPVRASTLFYAKCVIDVPAICHLSVAVDPDMSRSRMPRM